MALPLVPLVISLASQFAPQLIRHIAGEKAGAVAEQVAALATAVTGAPDVDAAAAVMRTDPAKALEFQQAAAQLDAQLEVEYLKDRQDARRRDVELAKSGFRNKRADIMVALDVLGLIACLAVLVMFRGSLPGEVVGIVSTVAGIFGACLRDAHQFEFGSSRSSRDKDDKLAEVLRRPG